MKNIFLQPVGALDEHRLVAVESAIHTEFNVEVRRLVAAGTPKYAFDAVRRQFNSELILRSLIGQQPNERRKILAVTDVDLFIPMLSFVYGQAQLNGKVSVVSVARMRQEFYGLPESPDLTLKRTTKESLHELGHLFGLTHCLERTCPMALATVISQIDGKGESFCSNCSFLLDRALNRIP